MGYIDWSIYIKDLRDQLVTEGRDEELQKLDAFYRELAQPLAVRGIGNGGELNPVLASNIRGGGANIEKIGSDGAKSLGGSSAGTRITVTVNGKATVQVDMYMLLSSLPCGSWVVGGPASMSIGLGGNLWGCSPSPGDPCIIAAWVQAGAVPVWVNFNP